MVEGPSWTLVVWMVLAAVGVLAVLTLLSWLDPVVLAALIVSVTLAGCTQALRSALDARPTPAASIHGARDALERHEADAVVAFLRASTDHPRAAAGEPAPALRTAFALLRLHAPRQPGLVAAATQVMEGPDPAAAHERFAEVAAAYATDKLRDRR